MDSVERSPFFMDNIAKAAEEKAISISNGGKKDNRKRWWLFVVYPESAPEDWFETLKLSFSKLYRSPLHDKDTNADGTPKKAHYHVVAYCRNKLSFEAVKAITDSLHQPIPQYVKNQDPTGAIRYLIHLDNPDKYQYDAKDIVTAGTTDLDKYLLSTGDTRQMLRDIIRFCKEHRIYSLSLITDYAIECNPQWADLILDSKTYSIKEQLKSAHWEMETELRGEAYEAGMEGREVDDYANRILVQIHLKAKEFVANEIAKNE